MKYSSAFEIVGVFADFKMNHPRSRSRAVFLRALSQPFTGYTETSMSSTESASMIMNAMLIAFKRPQQNVDQLVRRTMASIDPNLTIFRLEPLEAQVAGNFNQERLIARLTSLFGMLALVLASVGLYGVMSYFVAQRTERDRHSDGAGRDAQERGDMVMRGAMMQILIGLLLGIPAGSVCRLPDEGAALWRGQLRSDGNCRGPVDAGAVRGFGWIYSGAARGVD